ncbi:dienelactone hydrolase family protein [Paraburkholderia sp. J63]|uniref:dienelactone hydrolase family protein n=1 Tax=Paraburkholderia sp. J63 TaxID=2805434 RepID=UPI002ABD5BB7|nr:dienelactone hydrolase family protein [Paraburkholderia sp. J63]
MSVNSRWIEIANGSETFQGYLSLPKGGKGPGIVVIQEIFGVNAHIRSVADRYAAAGYVALAPDIFWRAAPRVELGYDGADRQKAMEIYSALDVERAVGDVRATAGALRALPNVVGKVAAVGYCLGGRLAYRASAQGAFDIAVAYYGGGIQNELEYADKINVPMQFHYGALDNHIPTAAVDSVKQCFTDKHAQIYVYEGAEHGFNCEDRASYNQIASTIAFGRTLTFLGENS